MAKKVVIVDEELTPTVLATKKVKRGSMIWLLLIFAALIAAAIYLPEITAYVSQKLGLDIEIPNEIVTPGNDDTDDDNSNDDEAPELQKYALTADLSFTVDNLTLSNFEVTEQQITFNIANNGTEAIDLSEMHYYLNMYSTDAEGADTLLERIKVADNIINAGGNISVTYNIKATGITEVAFLEISEEEYPAYVADADEAGNATLVCQKDYETVTYSLNNNQVFSIIDNYVVPTNDPNYNVFYGTYQTLAATYSTISGVSSNVSTDEANMYFVTSINLRTVVDGTINNDIYYPLNTDAKVMKFELEAQGYTCS